MAEKPTVDRGWAWVILVTNILALVTGGGVTFTVGIFNVVFLEVFGEGKSTTAWVGSLAMGVQYLTGPVSSYIVGRFGWRVACMLGGITGGLGLFLSSWVNSITLLYVTFGFMIGCGLGINYISSTVVIAHYFQRYRVLALGLVSAGVSFGTLIFPFIIQGLMEAFSWRQTLVFMSCICLQNCVYGALWRPLRSPVEILQSSQDNEATQFPVGTQGMKAELEEAQENRFLLQHPILQSLCQPTFFLYGLSLLGCSAGMAIVYLHLSAFTLTQGASGQEAAAYLSIIGISGFVGRGLTGLAGNDSSMDVLLLYIGSQGFLGICTLFLPLLASVFYVRVLYACLFGIHSGVATVLLAPVTIKLLGLKQLNAAFGVGMVLRGVACLCAPPAAGGCFLSCAFIAMLIPTAQFARGRNGHDDVEKDDDVTCEKRRDAENDADVLASGLSSVKELEL